MPGTIIKTKPVFKPDISFELSPEAGTERCTIVHCRVQGLTLIRIWPTTFLIQEDGTRKSLLHAYNITAYPDWRFVIGDHCFTLVFEGLDRGCRFFDLLEDIPEPGGFHYPKIERNGADVYWIDVE